LLGGAVLAALTGACAREALPEHCPALDEGELVLTELRGPQSGSDTWGEWLELFNRSGEQVDLAGLELTLTPGDGGDPIRLLVRRELIVEPEDHVVLGAAELDEAPPHMDYGLGAGFDGFPGGGVIEVDACDEPVDRLVYLSLPERGTWSFDGAKPPTAPANDEPSCWCADTTEPEPGAPMTEIGVPGTPGEVNRPCP
jgi:hypothetical protein